jgi:hypothetical protein
MIYDTAGNKIYESMLTCNCGLTGGCNLCRPSFIGSIKDMKVLQVGQTTACGHCHPEKFEDCAVIEAKYGVKCHCVCHDKKEEVEKLK